MPHPSTLTPIRRPSCRAPESGAVPPHSKMKPLLPTGAALLLLSACASRSPEALLRSKDAHEPARVAAAAQASDPDLLWKTMARQDLLPVRQAAASRLWSLDGDAFWKRVEKDYAQVNHGPLWNWLCAEAGKAKEKRALRAMVLSWGKLDLQVAENERPEKEAVEKIGGWPALAILANLVSGKMMAGDAEAQRSAWMAAARLLGPSSIQCHSLSGIIPATSDLHLVKSMELRLSELPIVDEEIDILRFQAALPQRTNQPRVPARGLALARRQIRKPCDTIERELFATSTLYAHTLVPRTKDAPLLSQAQPSPADLAVCHHLRLALAASPPLVAALFAEADADLSDKKSEHGGLLYWNDKNEVIFEPVPASFRRHDEIYLPPESLFEKLRDGLAHVHFHAQKQNNGEYAGPGKGDLEFVERNRVNAVVFTFIDKDTLNTDAFFPGKIVVDLGCIKRPK